MLAVALQGGHSDHIVQNGGDHIFLFSWGQGAFHDLRIVQHVVDLAGETFPRQFDRCHIRPNIRGKLLSQRHLTDSDYHVDRRAELMGNIGQKKSILLSGCLQLGKYPLVPRTLRISPVDPVSGQRRGTENNNGAEQKAEDLVPVHPAGNGLKDQAVVQQHQDIQTLNGVRDPLFVHHE